LFLSCQKTKYQNRQLQCCTTYCFVNLRTKLQGVSLANFRVFKNEGPGNIFEHGRVAGAKLKGKGKVHPITGHEGPEGQ